MAKASLHIELANATVKAGEPVRGEVVVQSQADVRCGGVTVRRRWYAHGDGTPHHAPWSETKIAPAADWTAGMEYRYPFEIPTDAAPVSYHGKRLQVDWVLQASAALPWALDPSAETPFLVLRGDAPASWQVAAPPPGSRANRWPIVGGMAVGVLGTAVAGVGVVQFVEKPFSAAWFIVAVGAVLAAIGLFAPIRRKMAEHLIGHPEVRIDPSTARPGTVVVTTFRSRPPKAVTLTGAFVRFSAHELVVSGGGRSSSVRTHDVEMGTVHLGAAQISTSPAIELTVPFTIPADAPPSFSTTHNELTWSVQVSIGIQGEPSWESAFPLLVQ